MSPLLSPWRWQRHSDDKGIEMKKLLGTDISGSYTFAPAGAGSGTITFSGLPSYVSLGLQNILLITNTTANTIIYNFADSSTGAVSFTNNILTLDASTTGQSSTDKLQIYLDLPSYEESLHDLLRRMNKLLESNSVVDNRLRQRVTIDAIGNSTAGSSPTEITTTVPVSGTVTATVSTIANGVGGAVSVGSLQSPAQSPYNQVNNYSVSPIWETPVDQRWRVLEDARNSYSNAIRRNLIFS